MHLAASLRPMSNSGEWSAPDRFSGDEVELVDEIVLSEDILDEDGSVIGEHVETIDILEVNGQGVVVIDDVTIVTDDEGDLMIDETEGDVMVEEHFIAADAEGNVVVAESLTIVDGGELDDRQLASALREELDGVERALERLDEGSYGLCDSCGTPIDDAVLAEMPQARSCSAHLV